MKKTIRCLCVLILTWTLVGTFGPAPVRAASFTVDTTTDAPDSNTADGTCYNGVDGCSLRAAIEQAFTVSSVGSPLTINFWSGIAGTLTLSLGPINWVADYVTLDGGTYGITISGAGLSAGQSIFTISGSHNIIDHLTIRNAPSDGVQMGDFTGTGAGNYNTVSNSYLLGNGESGVFVHGSASGGQGNQVSSNYIGVSDIDTAGCAAGDGNKNGVYVNASASATVVNANWIGCSSDSGIWIDGYYGTPTGTIIKNNKIGLGYGGAKPNYSGVTITDGTMNTTVGGTDSASPSDRNVISGNSGCGLSLLSGATNNTVDFNLIGLNLYGTAAVPNGMAGVCIFNANNNSIGSSHDGISQFISGNTSEGIYIENSSGNLIGLTNRIGVGTDESTAIGNGLQGVMLSGASNTYVVPNVLSYNGGAGVAVVGNTAIGNMISPLHTRSNAGLPIDLGNDGATANGTQTPPGPNNWLGYPVITSASGNPVMIHFTTCANCIVIIYRALGNPTANGGGGDLLDMTTADGTGIWSYLLPAGLTRSDVSLVAQKITGPAGDTSEMSPINNYKIYMPLVRR